MEGCGCYSTENGCCPDKFTPSPGPDGKVRIFIVDHVLLNNQQQWLMKHTIPYNKLPIQSFVKIPRVVHATHMSLVAALMESVSLEVPAKRVAHAR